MKALTVTRTSAPPALKMPSNNSTDLLARVPAQLHLFDAVEGVFMLQDNNVTASVIDAGNWECISSFALSESSLTFRLVDSIYIQENLAISVDGS